MRYDPDIARDAGSPETHCQSSPRPALEHKSSVLSLFYHSTCFIVCFMFYLLYLFYIFIMFHFSNEKSEPQRVK